MMMQSTATTLDAADRGKGRATVATLTLLAALATAPAAFAQTGGSPLTVTPAEAVLGSLPPGFDVLQTGGGSPARWEVVADDSLPAGKAIAQLSKAPERPVFPLLVYAGTTAADVVVTTRFKAIDGAIDQAGGLVVRLTDADNYYVVRANALEDNVRFYRVVNGAREQLASADLDVTPMEWHTLSLRAQGDAFTVSYDGRELSSVNDTTLTAAGRVGFWTKADSVTHFDGLTIEPL